MLINKLPAQKPIKTKTSAIVSDEQGNIFTCILPEEMNCYLNFVNINTNRTPNNGGGGGGGSGGGNPNPPQNPQCGDNIDNDNDNFIDLQDPGCINETDSTETLDSEYQGLTIEELKQKFDSSFTTGQYSSSYFTEPYVAGLLSIYEAIQDVSYIDEALDRVEFLTTNMNDSNNDGYNELYPPWCSGTESYNGFIMCSCLDMERGTRQFARLARIIKNDPELNLTYGVRADNIQSFPLIVLLFLGKLCLSLPVF